MYCSAEENENCVYGKHVSGVLCQEKVLLFVVDTRSSLYNVMNSFYVWSIRVFLSFLSFLSAL